MMRPWLIWTLFAVCLAVLLSAMGWASITVLRLENAEALARRQAEVEESVRLALWRMDSALAPIIARESTWPYFAYASFYPAQRAYTNMLMPVEQGEILVPSSLLNSTSPQALLHFQIGPDESFSSPQVPMGSFRQLAMRGYTTQEAVDVAAGRLDEIKAVLSRDKLLADLQPPETRDVRVARLQHDLPQRMARQQLQFELQQASQAQMQSAQQTKGQTEHELRQFNYLSNALTYSVDEQSTPADSAADVQEGMTRALWLSGNLVLARRVVVNGSEYVQGCWLDWPAIQRFLLDSVNDLLPNAEVQPVHDASGAADGDTVLAALPVRLVAGPVASSTMGRASPLRLSLAVAWGCVLLAGGAVAVLLAGTLSLSERRGAFVSAVTHEMRTPLTTFRMYTEMLVKGMVPDERRTRYLDTLRIEADRLYHLVENVLAYARLERDKHATRLEHATPAAIVERSGGRLADRAEQAGMQLIIENEAASACVHTDSTAIEQILFNLVDNACKYAADAEDQAIHLRISTSDEQVHFEVADRGPGISPDQQRRLFRPFSKSAHQAAHSAPGVGLGLALSRRLARRMGGDLCYKEAEGHGAVFVLKLPTF